MEANLYIKNAEVEGNKIKNIEFYGDWEVDMDGGDDPSREKIYVPEYIETYPLGADTIPYHVNYSTRVNGGVEQFGLTLGTTDNPCPFKYNVRVRGSIFANLKALLEGSQGIYWPEPTTATGQADKTKGKVFFFTEDFKHCVGITSVHWGA